jgi:hypothetical protein
MSYASRLGKSRLEQRVARLRLWWGLAWLSLIATHAAACPPEGFDKQQLLELKATQFNTLPADQRESLALALLACLDYPDPVLRDDIAFESLSTLMRSQQISAPAATKILERLQPQLAAEFSDPAGFTKPFAALTLAEVARMDRIQRFLSAQQWSALLQAATNYMSGVRDYRGFDQIEGWRHGVAHGADLLLQLSVNPRANKADLDAVLAAVATQVVPTAGHSYIYGEPLRLARPTFYVAQRNFHTEQEWSVWLQAITQPAPLAAWSDAFKSQGGLAKRHNTTMFLSSLYVLVQENATPATRERLLKPLQAALAAVP